jgi:hypothetical protein
VPIGVAFSALALWSQIEAVAKHPYVDRIEPAFGEAARLGLPRPKIPEECPKADDAPAPKLVNAANLEGTGRKPVVVEVNRQVLPDLRPCGGRLEACDDFVASEWERTIVSRRVLTCVTSWIESKLGGPAPEVAYYSGDGDVTGPTLPPFGDVIHANLAFGLGLTWIEATEVAKHPFVSELWTSPGIQYGTLPSGCPLDYDSPLNTPLCAVTTEPIDGKFTAASRTIWEASQGPNEVVISVAREQALCPRPACPGPAIECPELQRYNDRVMKQAAASQTCVRTAISAIGGSASPEVFVFGNGLAAKLTWGQIQTIAARSDVLQIDPEIGTPPP